MKQFSWLHLTDLHTGLGSQDHLWPNIQEAFFKDLGVMHERTGPWDAIFFTGDLVQSGQSAEFKRLDQQLRLILDKIRELGSLPLLFSVPGNHDLTRPEQKKSPVRLLLKWNDNPEIHDEFWSDPESEYRQVIQQAFANYADWHRTSTLNFQNIRFGLIPGDFSAVIKKNDFQLGILGINTSFLQLSAGNYKGRLVWDQRQFHVACGGDGTAWANANNVSILLTHHGPEWLDHYSNTRVAAEIAPAGRFALHLFGHMHSARTYEEAEGGGPFRRYCQGKSLFGLEQYGDSQKETRLHGYSVGMIILDENTSRIRIWPRRARFHEKNGWQLIPDHESFSLSPDEGTESQGISVSFKSRSSKSNIKNAVDSAPSHATTAQSDVGAVHAWSWPSSEQALTLYCEAVCKAHSHIRFVEIPYLKDVSDVELDNLFVEPRLSVQEIHPDVHTMWPKCTNAIEVLSQHSYVILLGDPGSGKSTLVSCLSWQLCRPEPFENHWTRNFGGRVPLPMILRELKLKADLTWETLIDAFLEHRIGKLLQRRTVESLLDDGRAIVLLDGLDEIGNLTIRRRLKQAVHAGMAAYPDSRWIMTSRIVGYEQVPFHYKTETFTVNLPGANESVQHTKRRKRIRTEVSRVFYQAPFSDEQIQLFSRNWYSQHEKEPEVISSNAQDFVQAVQENEGTQRLARIPYLLTLMALVHHKHTRLPHGRTELYERIATAYLESIDLRRQLDQLPYSLAQKKRWLADVAFRMQLRRIKQGSAKGTASNQNLLATKKEVQKWLQAAMVESGARRSKDESEALLRYFAQRSGLLVPRGEGKFAFMHLSLQEYFAASFLEPRLTASRFSPKRQKVEPTNQQLRSWVNSDVWRETFVLLFELLSAKSTSETEAFLEYLFKERLENDAARAEGIAAALLAELVTDSFVVLSTETARKMKQLCWRWALSREKTEDVFFWLPGENPLKSLLRETHGDLRKALKAASMSQSELRKVMQLDLSGCSSFSDLSALSPIRKLKKLNLTGCIAVEDLRPLKTLKNLASLSLEGCSNEESGNSSQPKVSKNAYFGCAH